MDRKEYRLLVLLSNILSETYTKSFDCNEEKFTEWLKTEVGFKDDDLEYIKNNSSFGNLFKKEN